jgi:hypothetical protein
VPAAPVSRDGRRGAGRRLGYGLARWLSAAYLLLFMVLAVPISLAGAHLFGMRRQRDAYPA